MSICQARLLDGSWPHGNAWLGLCSAKGCWCQRLVMLVRLGSNRSPPTPGSILGNNFEMECSLNTKSTWLSTKQRRLSNKYPQKQDNSATSATFGLRSFRGCLALAFDIPMTKGSTIFFSLDPAESSPEPTNGS